MARLNEAKLQVLLKDSTPRLIAVGDGTGLCLRIRAGEPAWILRYRHAGRPRSITLGKYPACSLKDAQKRATKERARINDGVDPVAERRRSKLALRAAKTFQDLAQDYQDRALPDLKSNTARIVRQFLTRDILPRLGALPIKDVSGGHVVKLVEDIGKRSDSAARRAFEIVSVVFAHGVAKQMAAFNPCASLKLKAILGKKRPIRPRVSLTEDQLRSLFTVLPKVGRRNALAIKILLATMVRKSELRLATPQHLDLKAGFWTIPAENAKNAKSIVIPLAPVVVGWFEGLLKESRGRDWVIPGTDPSQPIGHSTFNAAILRLKGVPRFTPHDLRRTARTHLGRLGVDIITAEKCLNHTLGGLVDVYDRGDYLEERRRALQLWTEFLVRCGAAD